MSMQVAFPFLLREQVIYWDPTTGLDGGWFQQTMSNKSEHVANPTPILCQCIWQMYSYLTNADPWLNFSNPLPIRQSVPNLMPIQCQCKWPFRSYSGNKLSTGTHHWSRRRMIWVNQFPIRHYTNPLQCQSWSTQFQSCVNPGQSSVNTPQFRYQSGRHLGQSIANPLSVPDKSAHVWPTHQSNANIGLICQSRVNPPIQYQSANSLPIRQSNTNLPI